MNVASRAPGWSKELISPTEARGMLADSGLSLGELADHPMLRGYRDDLASGRWLLNGDTVVFDSDGILLDGKVRLAACAFAGIPLPTFVVRGVDPSASATIDARRKRRSGDVLYVAGIDNAHQIASAANVASNIANGSGVNAGQPITGRNIRGFTEDHPGLVEAISDTETSVARTVVGPSVLAGIVYLTRLVDAEASGRFLAGFEASLSTDGDHGTFFTLRRSLEALRKDGVRATDRRVYESVYMLKAWNAFRVGTRIAHLKFERDEIVRMLGLTPAISERFARTVPPALGAGHRPSEVERYAQEVFGSSVRLEIVTMTPEYAERLLENNGPMVENEQRNRKISAQTIASYARDMKAGNWLLNGQAIKVSADGRLLDGQHRLGGCVRAGEPFETFVVHGLPDEVFSTYDLGQRKTFAAEIRKAGIANGTVAQVALRIIWQRETVGWDSGIQPTHAELAEALRKHGEALKPSLAFANRKSMASMLPVGTGAALHYILTRMAPEDGPQFFSRFESGANLSENSPILRLIKKITESDSSRGRRVRLSERQRLALVTQAFAKFARGESMTAFRNQNEFRDGFGDVAEV